MKRSQRPSNKRADALLDKICNNSVSLSRWLALMEGIRRTDEYEEKNNLSETDLSKLDLVSFVDELAPQIEFNLKQLNGT